MKIKDGTSLLELISYNYKPDSRIAIQTSQSRANVVVVLKDTNILILLVYSHSVCAVSK